VLVYSVCTISPREGPEQIAAFTDRHPQFAVSHTAQTLPHVDRTDGFFIAGLEREGP
jgi:16S rRNA (cytosine967-C5)-methyltransferase